MIQRSEVADIIDRIDFVRWRDTHIENLQYYYAESEQYVIRQRVGELWCYAFVNARSPMEAANKFVEETQMEENKVSVIVNSRQPGKSTMLALAAELVKKQREVEQLKKQLSDRADEGYAGFLIGIDQMQKTFTEMKNEIERLKVALKDIIDDCEEARVYAVEIQEIRFIDEVEQRAKIALTGKDNNVPANAPDTNVGRKGCE